MPGQPLWSRRSSGCSARKRLVASARPRIPVATSCPSDPPDRPSPHGQPGSHGNYVGVRYRDSVSNRICWQPLSPGDWGRGCSRALAACERRCGRHRVRHRQFDNRWLHASRSSARRFPRHRWGRRGDRARCGGHLIDTERPCRGRADNAGWEPPCGLRARARGCWSHGPPRGSPRPSTRVRAVSHAADPRRARRATRRAAMVAAGGFRGCQPCLRTRPRARACGREPRAA